MPLKIMPHGRLQEWVAAREWTEAHHLFSGAPTAGYAEAALV
jgi:hypothetical protein